jgi:hypothetical protein
LAGGHQEKTSTYLAFAWHNTVYKYRVLPFGLAIASFVFTKIIRMLAMYFGAGGVRLLYYLDDFMFLCGPNKSRAARV